MQINPHWRILTIGDGDLSFSRSLWQHHKPAALTATILDSHDELTRKYGDAHYQALLRSGARVLTEVDVTHSECRQKLPHHSFDLVLFQFPLIPGFVSEHEFLSQCGKGSVNTLNRALLRCYLENCFNHFLDPNGPQLAVITSKDVKPYRGWDIENALHQGTQMRYLGSMPFDIKLFPGYRVRHVDADRHVKDTQGISYFWSFKEHPELISKLKPAQFQGEDCCAMCRTGPFMTARDREAHLNSRSHQIMQTYAQQWLAHLAKLPTDQ